MAAFRGGQTNIEGKVVFFSDSSSPAGSCRRRFGHFRFAFYLPNRGETFFMLEIKLSAISETGLGGLLHFGQLFEAFGKKYFAQIALLGNFCKCVKIFHFSCEILFGQLLKRHLATFCWSRCLWCSFYAETLIGENRKLIFRDNDILKIIERSYFVKYLHR